ncbi:MAG TPA: hypothetical protein VGK30_03755 [Candidatus Binatia bacterium]
MLLVLALGIAACQGGGSPMGKSKPWDAYAGEKLRVHGQDPATAGQKVWRALREEDSLRAFLARQGEPDSLEVLGGTMSRFSDKTIVLYYTRRSMGPPHSIRLEPSKDGYTPRGSEPLAAPPTSDRGTGGGGRRGRASDMDSESPVGAPHGAVDEDTEAPPPARAPRRKAATAEQRVTCPVDPTRADCQALCASDATLEWCH